MQKLEAKIPYLGLLPNKERFYEVAGIDYQNASIKVFIDENRTKVVSGKFDPNYCEIRFKKEGLFDL